MNEAWLNAPSLEMDTWFWEIFIYLFFFEKMMMILFKKKKKKNEAWPIAPRSTINVNFEKSIV